MTVVCVVEGFSLLVSVVSLGVAATAETVVEVEAGISSFSVSQTSVPRKDTVVIFFFVSAIYCGFASAQSREVFDGFIIICGLLFVVGLYENSTRWERHRPRGCQDLATARPPSGNHLWSK